MAYKLPPATPTNSVTVKAADGETVTVYKPVRRMDVLAQPKINAAALATLAFASVVDGRLRWSDYTNMTFRRLAREYGDDALRTTLAQLLEEMHDGLQPTNPIGLLIHRVRLTANSTTLRV